MDKERDRIPGKEGMLMFASLRRRPQYEY